MRKGGGKQILLITEESVNLTLTKTNPIPILIMRKGGGKQILIISDESENLTLDFAI
jgi:hypothetical protein